MNEVTCWSRPADPTWKQNADMLLKRSVLSPESRTEKGPGLSVQDRDDGSSSGKVQLSRHCGRGRSPLCKTVQHVTGCQYQVPHKQCHSASVTTPYLSPMLQRTVQELLLLKTTPGKMKRTQRKGFWVDCCSGIQICVFKEIFLTIIRLTLTTSISMDTVPSLCRLLGVSLLRENANSGSSNNGSYRVWGEGPQTAVPCHCHNHTTLT